MSSKLWSKEELEFVRTHYNIMSLQELSNKLGRTKKAISVKACISKITSSQNFYSEEETAFIRDNYSLMTTSELAEHLGRTFSSIEGFIRANGFKKGNKKWSNRWKESELSYLKSNYADIPVADIASKLGRSNASITRKASDLGLRKYKKRSNWSQKEIDYLTDNYESGLMIKFQKDLTRTFKAIHTKANELGLKRDMSTYIELEVEAILEEMNVPHEREVTIRGFIADFVLSDKKVIEVHGDYWHCNPVVYDSPKNEIQEHKIKQDRMKRGCFNELGYTILYIWEYDLNNNFDQVVEKIKQFAV